MSVLKRIAAAAAAAAVVVTLTPGSSSAESKSFSDAAGDSTGKLDLYKLRFHNGENAIKAKMTFTQKDRKKGVCLVVPFNEVGKHAVYTAGACIPNSGKPVNRLLKNTDGHPHQRVRCHGYRVHWSAKGALHAKIRVPQKCVHKVGKTWFAASTLDVGTSGTTDDSYKVDLDRG